MTGEQPPDEENQDRARLREIISRAGPLAWMAKNTVAANMLMLVLLIGGAVMVMGGRIRQEVFPEVDLDLVTIEVPYPSASPEEVEQGVLLSIEEAVRGLDGVKEVRSTAVEGRGVVVAELLLGVDPDRVLSDIKGAVDRVTSLPEDAERPVISLATNRAQVISLVLYGEVGEAVLRQLAERARDTLLQDARVTQVDLSGVRAPEIGIEVPRAQLRKYDLTLEGIAQTVRRASIDLPAGDVKTEAGDVLIRTKERRARGAEFEEIVLRSLPDGTVVRVGDIAHVKDGFAEVDREARFNGKPAVMLNVYRVGRETPLDVSDAVHEYVEGAKRELPPGVDIAVWSDISEIYRDRIDLLMRNAYLGLILVFLCLGAFLELRLALWVTFGIPTSFLGALLFMPAADVSINMISLFAFILTLGMVVDDAIVVGEAAYRRMSEGYSAMEAAILGVREVAVPVVFAIATTCAAFSPMFFVPGVMGKFFRVIPLIVIMVLIISLVESLLILPAHLGHLRTVEERGFWGFVHRQQQRSSAGLEWFIARAYRPFLELALRYRYVTMAACVAALLGAVALPVGGRVQFTFFPKIDGDVIEARLEMPVGTPFAETRRMEERMVEALRAVLNEVGKGKRIDRGIYVDLGSLSSLQRSTGVAVGNAGGHLATAMVYLVPTDQRTATASEISQMWREQIGQLPGVERLSFQSSTGGPSGAPINLELSHPDDKTLEKIAGRLAVALSDFAGVTDIDKGFVEGKTQFDLKLTAEGRALGLNESDLARQVRSAFFGAEAVRQQRGRDEIRTYVRLPAEDRRSLHTVEELVLLSPHGPEIPLSRAATVERGRSYTRISRTDGRRTLNVTAEIVPGVANANEVMEALQAGVLPELKSDYPALGHRLGGQQRDQAETLGSLRVGGLLALFAIFSMLAIVFRSYMQPLIVMTAIPFGLVGSIIGHLLMGYDLSLMSMMGLVALAGVSVNDSLVLVDAVNEFRRRGAKYQDAVVAGGMRRFRPILLTSLTTFFGLTPMITETSVQARFLIPMAISLGFGVMFATVTTLLFVPALYLALEDAKRALSRVRDMLRGGGPHEQPAE